MASQTSYFPLQKLSGHTPAYNPNTPELYDPYSSSHARTSSPTRYNTLDESLGKGVEGFPLRPTVLKRYSGQWWSYRWDREVVRGFLPRIIYVLVGFTLMGIWIGLIFFFANREAMYQSANAERDVAKLRSSGLNLSEEAYLKAVLRKFDTDSRSLTVQWSAVFLKNESKGTGHLEFMEMELANGGIPMGFYRDMRSIYDDNATQTLGEADEYYFKVDNETEPRLGVLGVHTWDAIDTDIDMSASAPGDIWKEPLFGYPWDEWTGSIVTVMNDMTTSEQLNRSGAIAFPLSSITIDGSVLNWKIEGQSVQTPACTDDTPLEESTCELTITFTARRPGIVIFCVIAVVIVNWLSTIAIFLVTGEAVLLRRSQILEGTDILGVCFSALFALPTVRSLLPGAPTDFGAVIDLIGILPNVIIISICTMVFSAAKLNLRLEQHFAAQDKR